jgi:hypothetical protein
MNYLPTSVVGPVMAQSVEKSAPTAGTHADTCPAIPRIDQDLAVK